MKRSEQRIDRVSNGVLSDGVTIMIKVITTKLRGNSMSGKILDHRDTP